MASIAIDSNKTEKQLEITDSDDESLSVDEWLKFRKEAGLKIDPENAEVEWFYIYTLDPYDVLPELPPEYRQVGRDYFARSPESDGWVWFGDLPEEVSSKLWEMYSSKLAFPAGLPFIR